MIECKNLTFKYDKEYVFKDLNIKFEDNKSYAIIGKSGCGKTTLLRTIIGLEDTNVGSVIIDNVKVNGTDYVHPSKRNASLVFQDYALFPHLSVQKNIVYGLSKNHDISDMCKMLGIEHLLAKSTSQLSGGEQQRVAIARAIVRNPKYLLLDEPFSNLDNETKNNSKELIKKLCKNTTVIINSHNKDDYIDIVDEVITLTDIIKQ